MKNSILFLLIAWTFPASGQNLKIDAAFFANSRWEFSYILKDTAYRQIPDALKNTDTLRWLSVYPSAAYEFKGDSCVGYPTAMIDGSWTYRWKISEDSLYFYEHGKLLIAYKVRLISPDKIELTGVFYDRITGVPEPRIEFGERLKE